MFDLLGNVLDVLCTIGDGIASFFRFIGQVVEDIISVALNAGYAFIHIDNWLSALPSVVTSMLTAMLGIAVVYKILGREG